MKSKDCLFCGNNRVPHFLNWYFESVDILLQPLRLYLLRNPLILAAKSGIDSLEIASVAVGVFSALGIVTFNDQPEKCRVRRAQVLWEEALRRGIKMRELKIFGFMVDAYWASGQKKGQATKDRSTVVFSGLPRPTGYDNSALDVMDDKIRLKVKLLAAGLPVPEGGSCRTFFQARKIFRKIALQNNGTVIVKPRTGSRGRHSTICVRNEADLKVAFRIAKKICHWAVVEQQLWGPVYRATVVNYRLVGVLRGDPPEVTGDGQTTLGGLVDKKNLAPHMGMADIAKDVFAAAFIIRQLGLSFSLPTDKVWEYVLPAGKTIALSSRIGVGCGGSSSEDFEICHPDNVKLFEQAAKVVGDPLVGFDFIIPDITISYKSQICGFLEANSLPFINLHHDPLKGKPRNVAKTVWDMMGF